MADYTAPSMFGFDLFKKRKGMRQYNDAAAERLQPGQSVVSGVGGGGYGAYGGGQGNLFGAGGSITRDQADALQNNPLWNVQASTHQSAPYPDAILREQAAINAGYDPNFQPNVSGVPPSQRAAEASAQRAANQDISPIGGSSYATATEMAGESQTITNFSKSLDRDFLAAAFGSLMQPPQEGSAAGGGMGDVRINQPQPGDFGMQFSMYGDKKKKRGLFG